MKYVNRFLYLSLIIVGISCNKTDNYNYPAGTVGHSRIIYFPSVAIKGSKLVIVQPGTTYTEPGVTSLLNGQSIAFTTSATIDATKPGIYILTYTAKNSEGYTASDTRTVVVIGNDVATHDYSGKYARSSNGEISTWTKTANGVYTVVNPGGAASVTLTATVVNYSGNNIAIPQQITSVGQMSSSGGIYTPDKVPPQYQWVIISATYGTAVRTFNKQ